MDTNVFDFGGAPQDKSDSIMGDLNDTDISIMAYLEQLYWTHGSVPTYEKIAEGLNLSVVRVRESWKKERFRNAVVARGIELDRRGEDILSPAQITLVNMLLNVHDKNSLRQKLEACGISTAKYNAWLRDPAFQSYLKLRTEQLFEGSDHEAYKSLLEAVTDGDVQAMKLFFEMRGIYNPRLTVEVNIETVVYRVVEIVAKHIRDPQILEAIATEIETLEVGQGNRAKSA